MFPILTWFKVRVELVIHYCPYFAFMTLIWRIFLKIPHLFKDKCLENDVENLCFNYIEWKFECPKCQRFMTMALKDFVLKISVKQEKSLDNLLQDFLNTKSCPCGQMCSVEPTIKKMGKYVFLEIDRTVFSGRYLTHTSEVSRFSWSFLHRLVHITFFSPFVIWIPKICSKIL